MERKAVGLLALNRAIKGVLKRGVPPTIWVVAEVVDIKVNRTGHCYLELSEKGENNRECARARATIWSSRYRDLSNTFYKTTGVNLSVGQKVMVLVSIEFHELYGFSLNITDIDPNYTLGDIAKRRKAIIEQLKVENLIDRNGLLELTAVPQRIAVVSSSTAAGFQDFIKQLESAEPLKFGYRLFETAMQGDGSERAVVEALNRIESVSYKFDIVVIVRGGGSISDLSSFDSYSMAKRVATMPIPVISGIGHDKDETIVDMVSALSLKTPTAVADFIIERADAVMELMVDFSSRVKRGVKELLDIEKLYIDKIQHTLHPLVIERVRADQLMLNQFDSRLEVSTYDRLSKERKRLDDVMQSTSREVGLSLNRARRRLTYAETKLEPATRMIVERCYSKLNLISARVELLDPINVLKRGFTLTAIEGRVVKSVDLISKGDSVVTQFFDGTVVSEVTNIEK